MAPEDRALIHYHLDLEEVGLENADSVVVDYWSDKKKSAQRLSFDEMDKSLAPSVDVPDGDSVYLFARAYREGKMVAWLRDEFIAGERKSAESFTEREYPLIHIMTIKDAYTDLKSYKSRVEGFNGLTMECEGELLNHPAIVDSLESCTLYSTSSLDSIISIRLVDEKSGNYFTEYFTIHIIQGEPEVTAGSDTLIGIGELHTFTGEFKDFNTKGSYDAEDGYLTQEIWSYGDGVIDTVRYSNQTSLPQFFTHRYADLSADTNYLVSYCATDDDGNELCDSCGVRVVNRAPVLSSISALSNITLVSEVTTVSVSASDADANGIDSLLWDLDGDGVYETLGNLSEIQSISFPDPVGGAYSVSVIAWDEWGAVDTTSRVFSIYPNRAPVISGIDASSTLVYPDDEITLTLSGVSDADNNGIDSVYWDLSGTGSGAFSTARSLSESVIYSNSVVGEYSIRARVHDVWGAWDTLTVFVHIYATFTDSRDGQEYAKVTIGNQVWMAENLKYLPQVDAVADGSEDVADGKYYYVYDYVPSGASEAEEIANAKATTNYQSYGVLYNWNAAMNGDAPSTNYQSYGVLYNWNAAMNGDAPSTNCVKSQGLFLKNHKKNSPLKIV
jgi:hypothetical protein